MNRIIDDFFVNIKQIIVAHQHIFYPHGVCNYAEGRKTFGIVHLLTGEVHFRFNDGTILKAHAGDVLLLKPTDAYTALCTSECVHYTVNFTIDEHSIEGDFLKDLFFSPSPVVLHKTPVHNAFSDRLARLCTAWQEKKEGYKLHALSLFYDIFYLFLETQIPAKQTLAYEKIKCAKAYIEAHWQENFSLQDLADLCFLSVPHFRHSFSQVFQIPPMEYRDSLRLLNAKDYLAQGGYSITEIAEKCGFLSVNYFSRFFKKHTGVSPKQYAKF